MFISLDLSRDLAGSLARPSCAQSLEDHGVALGPAADRPGPFSLDGTEGISPPESLTASVLFFAACAKALREAAPHSVSIVLGLGQGVEALEMARWSAGKPLVLLFRDQPSACDIPPEIESLAQATRCLLVSERLLKGLARQITSATNALDLLTKGSPVANLAIARPPDALEALALAERLLARDTVFSNLILEVAIDQIDELFLGRLADFGDWKISAGFSHVGPPDAVAETTVLVFSKQTFGAGIRDPANIIRETSLSDLLTRPSVGPLAARGEAAPAADRTRRLSDWSLPSRTYTFERPRTCVPDLHPYFAARQGAMCGGLRTGHRRGNVYVRAARAYGIGDPLDLPTVSGYPDTILGDAEGAASFPVDRIVDDPTVLLINESCGHAYFHYMIDFLPRAAALEDPTLACHHLLASSGWSAFHHESFGIFALGDPILVDLDTGVLLRDAILPSLVPRSDAVDFLRDRTSHLPAAGERRRLYVSRRSAFTRRVVNEDDLLPILSSYGFEIVEAEAIPLVDQITHFRAAEMICGPHGAGLTNMAFSPPGAQVIEFVMQERFPLGSVFWDLACAASHRYHAVIARKVANHFGSPAEGDFFVEPALLEQALLAASRAG